MDNSELVGTVFLDLSKAFDLVNHDILVAKLAKYHTSLNAIDWFRPYTSGLCLWGTIQTFNAGYWSSTGLYFGPSFVLAIYERFTPFVERN